jgi:predicted amidohydrolase
MQVHTYPVSSAPSRDSAMALVERQLDRWEVLIRSTARQGGAGVRKVLVFPEFALQGFPSGQTAAQWIERVCFDIPGPQTERLQKLASELRIYIGANAYWRDPDWSGHYFNTSFLINDSGDIILKYRRINTAQASSPHDFWEQYLDRVGIEGAFPVVATPLGNLAMMPCGEIMFPEAARMFMFQGAEVLLHPTSDFGAWDNSAWMSAKKVRASENMLYLVSANTAGFRESSNPESQCAGASQIIDWEGRVLAEASSPGECLRASTWIDIEMLRLARRSPVSTNRVLRNRLEAYRPLYNKVSFLPANTRAGDSLAPVAGVREGWKRALDNMVSNGMPRSAYED